MNFYKIFYFNFYMFFYHLIVVLPIDNYFQIYQIIFFFFKCASHFNQMRALSLGFWRPLRLSAPGAFTLSLSKEFVRYDGHVLDPLASLQFTRRTYYTPVSNVKQLAKDLCGGWCVLFLEWGYNLESLSYLVADSFSAFLGEQSLASKYDNPPILYETPLAKVKQVI